MHSSARRATAHRDLKELAALFIQCLLFQFMQLFGNRSPLSALPFFLSQQPFGHGPRAKRSRRKTRAGLVGYLFETAHNAIAPIRQPGAYIRSGELGSVVEVRTVTSRARRRGGSNTKSVMPRKLARGNRSSGTNLRHTQLADDFAPQRRLGLPNGYGTAAAGGFNYAPAVRIWLGVFPVQRLNACVNALTS